MNVNEMNSAVINKPENEQFSKQSASLKQSRLPLWLIVLVTVLSIVLLSTLGSYYYQQKEIQNTLKGQQSGLIKTKLELLQSNDVIDTNWLRTLNSRIKNVQGGVIWSSTQQQGIAHFKNLPKSKENQQYHLWAYDLSSNINSRISMSTFSVVTKTKSEFLIKMQPSVNVDNPYKFELMLEQKDANDKRTEFPLLLAQP